MLADYPIADSLVAGANVVAPAGSADIVALNSVPDGIYEILFSASVGAGAVAADNGNVTLTYNGATQIANVPTNGAQHRVARAKLTGVQNVRLRSVGAATAAVVYTGTLVLTRIG